MNYPPTSILMVTYRKDLDFAICAMRSGHQFATGFLERVLVVPDQDVDVFKAAAERYGYRCEGFEERAGKGMLHHMVMILGADYLCPGAEAVLHQDGDCLFTGPVTPADYFRNGRPILLRQRYAEFAAFSSRYSWKACVLAATGINPEWETMVRHPSVHLRETYALTRDAVSQHTAMSWKEYILSCRNIYPQTFAEFPTLGAVAIARTPEAYHWVDLVDGKFSEDPGPSKIKDFWSHGGLDMDNDRHPGKTARQAIEEILGERI